LKLTAKHLKIGVFGHGNARHLTKSTLKWAEAFGGLIASASASLYTGGGAGVMLAARRGCLAHGGTVISVNPEIELCGRAISSHFLGNIIASGQGTLGRVHLLTQSIDLGFAIGGGAGTLLEVIMCYLLAKPAVVVDGFQGKIDPCVAKILSRAEEEVVSGVPVLSGYIDAKNVDLVCPVSVCPSTLSPEEVLNIGLTVWLARRDKTHKRG
jgi:uncharacterized protein (TIGR00725 family)